MMRITPRLAALATVVTAGLGLAAVPAAASPAQHAGTTRLWVARLHTGNTIGRAVAVSPDGSTVFTTGQHNVTSRSTQGETVAYNATTGAQIWQSADTATNSAFEAIAAARDGSAVFATGYGKPSGATRTEALTVAYNAATGATLWAQAVGPAGEGRSIAVAPDGSAVFITGNDTCGNPATTCYMTASYNAATGAVLWTQQVPNTGVASSVAVAAGGSAVFVTGSVTTVAYNAVTGAALWTQPVGRIGEGRSIAVAPGGSAVFVAGDGSCQPTSTCYVTAGLDAATGASLWTQTFSNHNAGYTAALAVSPDGSKVFVTGQVGAPVPFGDYGTVAYDATTGAQLWKALYQGPDGGGGAADIAVSPDGSDVFVTGDSYSAGFTGHAFGLPQYTTLAYSSSTGAQAWVTRFGNVAKGSSYAYSIAVAPDGSSVFVTGQNVNNLTTVAYSS